MSSQPSPNPPHGESAPARRPLKTRQRAWPRALAATLIRFGLTPNQISVLSIFFAAVAAYAFLQSGDLTSFSGALWLLVAAAGIQLRLLCNLIDGLMAVEGGLKSRTGDLFNDLPDRISDSLILLAAGYALPFHPQGYLGDIDPWKAMPMGPTLGWAAALLAALTAYIRLLGGAAGTPQYFIGPMAKQQRMGLLTGACLLTTALAWLSSPWPAVSYALTLALLIIIVGSAITCVRRLLRIAHHLNSVSPPP